MKKLILVIFSLAFLGNGIVQANEIAPDELDRIKKVEDKIVWELRFNLGWVWQILLDGDCIFANENDRFPLYCLKNLSTPFRLNYEYTAELKKLISEIGDKIRELDNDVFVYYGSFHEWNKKRLRRPWEDEDSLFGQIEKVNQEVTELKKIFREKFIEAIEKSIGPELTAQGDRWKEELAYYYPHTFCETVIFSQGIVATEYRSLMKQINEPSYKPPLYDIAIDDLEQTLYPVLKKYFSYELSFDEAMQQIESVKKELNNSLDSRLKQAQDIQEKLTLIGKANYPEFIKKHAKKGIYNLTDGKNIIALAEMWDLRTNLVKSYFVAYEKIKALANSRGAKLDWRSIFLGHSWGPYYFSALKSKLNPQPALLGRWRLYYLKKNQECVAPHFKKNGAEDIRRIAEMRDFLLDNWQKDDKELLRNIAMLNERLDILGKIGDIPHLYFRFVYACDQIDKRITCANDTNDKECKECSRKRAQAFVKLLDEYAQLLKKQ